MTLAAWIGRWSPGIGDPTVGGWITVVAYFGTAWLCWRARAAAAREAAAGAAHRSRTIWMAFTLGLLALGVNKQLDLQSAVAEVGRHVLRTQGWERWREKLQCAFIVSVLFGTLASGLALGLLARYDLRRMLLPLIGGAELCAFVAVRASSFHHLDRIVGHSWAGLRLKWILELGGVALIALGALRFRARSSPSETTPATKS